MVLALAFFISLFSATCFFFDSHQVHIFGYAVHFPVGLLFFPLTYVVSNIVQDRSGRSAANTMVACSYGADIILVMMSWVIAHAGDRADYLSVFKDLPLIMGATFVFIAISSVINIVIFELLKEWRRRSTMGLFVSFFASITVAELAVSSMSMPLLFFKQGFSHQLGLTITLIVTYKLVFNAVATIGYVLCKRATSNLTEIA